jgi:1-acyl-sn-glycerol-3-phosphate acyltransferase
MSSAAPEVPPAFRAVMAVCAPVVRGWGRLEVTGRENLPSSGAVLLAGNHDSWWDPVVIGTAALERRQVQALAKSSLWKTTVSAKILDGMGQIPIERGKGDAGALDRAVSELRAGACIGIFLEGTRSNGRPLRARGGLGRIAQAVPEAQIVCCTVEGAVDLVRFPKRPRLRVRFFAPAGGGLGSDESSGELTTRLLAEIRAAAPTAAYGRRPGARTRSTTRDSNEA